MTGDEGTLTVVLGALFPFAVCFGLGMLVKAYYVEEERMQEEKAAYQKLLRERSK